jgi:hypothetical protein
MEFDTHVKLTIYRSFAETGSAPTPEEVAERVNSSFALVLETYQRLRAQRLLVLDANGSSIRMAPPFSGVRTQHVVEAAGIRYSANCAWDALGVPVALRKPAIIHSRCEQSHEPFQLSVNAEGPEPSDWPFHCLVPAAKWWEDIVFT